MSLSSRSPLLSGLVVLALTAAGCSAGAGSRDPATTVQARANAASRAPPSIEQITDHAFANWRRSLA